MLTRVSRLVSLAGRRLAALDVEQDAEQEAERDAGAQQLGEVARRVGDRKVPVRHDGEPQQGDQECEQRCTRNGATCFYLLCLLLLLLTFEAHFFSGSCQFVACHEMQ